MKKKEYGVFKNIKFTHKYILQDYSVKYCLGATLVVLANIFTTFMLTLLPAFVVGILVGESDVSTILMKLSGYCFILYTTIILSKRLERTINNKVNNNRMFKCLDYYDCIMKTNYQNIDVSTGRNIIDAGLDSYMDGYHEGFAHIITDFRVLIQSGLGLLVYCILIAKINIWLSLTLIAISAFSIIVNIFDKNWINKNKDEWFKIDTKFRYLSNEATSLKNGKDVRLYSIKEWFMETFQYLLDLRQGWSKKELRIYYLVNISERMLTAIKYSFAYFVVFNKIKAGMGVGQFVMTIGLILGVNNWVTSIFDNIKFLQLNNINVNNSRSAIELDDENHIDEDVVKSVPNYDKVHELRFHNVSFSFPESDSMIFKNFNLTIKAGEKLALVGVNGAGKTTLVKLMCGLYKPTGGKIYLDGIDINTYKKDDYFKVLSTVFQDFQVLALSIAENISCCDGSKTDYEKVQKCIKLSGLDEKISRIKGGVKRRMLRELEDDGVVFSGGETQKLMLARCLYKDSPIIILDEPTSALDPIAESEMYEKYSSLISEKMSIFISHRLSSTKFCDRIIMLRAGEIIEEGTHNELLEKEGEYAEMFNIQSSYYQEEVTEIGL